ncbi:MAG: M64 family metallopeptidase [Planctomycetota bacterium]
MTLPVVPFVLSFAAVVAPPGGKGGDARPRELVTCCHPGAHGILEGGPLLLEAPAPAGDSFTAWPFATIESNGPVGNRIDIVFVGDGFQSAQLAGYATIVAQRWATIRTTEPYVSYHRYFNAHRVDVASVDSGVDNDPTQGVLRNTALDMGFWCSGIERLLCVSTSKAAQAASCAPQWNQILAVANSTKYGGAGYPTNDVCTFSSGNTSSLEVALHELGHSFGDLADEYDYADGTVYSGPEVGEANVSIQTQAQMQAAGNKWSAWLGVSLPTVGTHGAFEGARYYQFGIRRPTSNSLMRSLGVPYNGPSLEQMIVKIHQQTAMVDGATPVAGSTVVRGAAVTAEVVQPSLHALSLQWTLNGANIPGATGASIDTAALPVGPTPAQLRLVIVDPTTKVRNETLRTQWMRETYQWSLVRDACPADQDRDGAVNGADLALLLSAWSFTGVAAGRADLDGDGVVGGADLALLLAAWGSCGA